MQRQEVGHNMDVNTVPIVSDTLLDNATAVWANDRSSHRERQLEVGSILHEFVLARLREGYTRKPDTRTLRGDAVSCAADRLGINVWRINTLIQVWHVVQLLAEGVDLSNLSWASLRLFRMGVCRLAYDRHDRNPDPTHREVWVRSEYAGPLTRLLHLAAEEGMHHRDVANCVRQLTGKALAKDSYSPKNDKRARKPTEESYLFACASVANPRDLAELITEAVSRSTDPALVTSILLSRLPKPHEVTCS
jgi:hypothetical protein